MKIYISASWKQVHRVRQLAELLRLSGHRVYDFTDQKARASKPIPPEIFPEKFDPSLQSYRDYLNRPEWKNAVYENRAAIEWADLIILLLPCGIDATADWAYGVGIGKKSIIIGHPENGDRSPVHLWADAILGSDDDVLSFLEKHRAGR